jgi:hypothetical protein
MIRTVVAGAPTRFITPPVDGDQGDTYLAKLVKYVPVEGLAPFLPIAAFATGTVLRWAVFAVCLIVGLALIVAQARKKGESPPVWYWPFVVVAFCAWSVGASQEFRELLGVSDQTGAVILALTATALPALDSALDGIFSRAPRAGAALTVR